MTQISHLKIFLTSHEFAISNENSPAGDSEKSRFPKIHRLRKLHFVKHKNKTEGGDQIMLYIKNHPETWSSNVIESEMNASKIINMKDNPRDSRNNINFVD